MIRVDAHEDLAWNMLTFGRDYTRSVRETRNLEQGGLTPRRNGDTMIGWPEWVRGRVGIVFATLFAAPAHRRKASWEVLCYQDPESAHHLYWQQVQAYARLLGEHPDKVQLVSDGPGLNQLLQAWDAYPASDAQHVPGESSAYPAEDGELRSAESSTSDAPPVGLVLLMEGADGVRQPGELAQWYEAGVRILGPAWSATRYAGGTWEPGGFTREGYALLEAMSDLGLALDISHLTDEGARQALDQYHGPVLASHSNARELLSTSPEPDRHLSDHVIRSIAERDGVVGIVLFNFFLSSDWRPSDGRSTMSLDHVAAQIDHVCQLTGDAAHVGIGSDFDGGFGLQGVPQGLDSIADLGLIGNVLQARGYQQTEIDAVLGGNWVRLLRRILQGGN